MLKTFILGAAGYPMLEVLTRGRTHWSMALAGGASTVLIRQVHALPIRRGAQAMLCGAGITAVEYAVGRMWNREHQVWDYRRVPLNREGQICLPYSLLWCALSAGALRVMDMGMKRPDS